jgi:predicted ribosomally synthesized peptide with SipW-like signal peptide
MNKKILASIMVVGLLALAIGWGTNAYFSDTEKSYNNLFTAGTVHSQLKDGDEDWADDVYVTWRSPDNWAPNEVVTATLHIRNIGTVATEWLWIKPTNIRYGGGVGGVNLANVVNITKFHVTDDYSNTYDIDPNWMATWGIWPETGTHVAPLTLAEFADGKYWFIFEPGDLKPLSAGTNNVVHLEMTFAFDQTAGNDYQGAYCYFDLSIAITQGPPTSFTPMGTYGYGN